MLLAPYCEWFYQITCPLEEEQMTAQSHKPFSGRKVDGTEMEGAEAKIQPHQTLHILLPTWAEAVLGIQKENLIKAKRTGILVLRRPVFCIWHWTTPVYDTKSLLKTLKDRKTNGQDLESRHQDERHWVLRGWGRRRNMENCKATFVHSKWQDSSATRANSCSASSALTAAASAGLSHYWLLWHPASQNWWSRSSWIAVKPGPEGKGFDCCWSTGGKCPVGTTWQNEGNRKHKKTTAKRTQIVLWRQQFSHVFRDFDWTQAKRTM